MKLEKNDTPNQDFGGLVKSLNAKIEKHTHDLKFYQTTRQILYEDNFLLKKKLNETLNLEDKMHKQIDKYQRIHNNALRTYKIQNNLLREMNNFEEFTSQKFDTEVLLRKNVCIRLEYDVDKKKKDIVKMQKNLDNIRKAIGNKEAEIRGTVDKNDKLAKENSVRTKEYLISKCALHQIFEQLEVNDIESVIKQYRDQSIQYEGKQSLV